VEHTIRVGHLFLACHARARGVTVRHTGRDCRPPFLHQRGRRSCLVSNVLVNVEIMSRDIHQSPWWTFSSLRSLRIFWYCRSASFIIVARLFYLRMDT